MALTKCKECNRDVSTEAEKCPNCGAKVPKRTGVLTWAIVIIVAIVVFPAVFSGGGGSSSASSSVAKPLEKSPHAQAMEAVSIKSMKWHTGGFDNVMLVTMTIQNKGAVGVKDIELTCTHTAKSGTAIDANKRVLFDVVAAGGSKTIKDFNMGMIHSQVDRSSCEITGLALNK